MFIVNDAIIIINATQAKGINKYLNPHKIFNKKNSV